VCECFAKLGKKLFKTNDVAEREMNTFKIQLHLSTVFMRCLISNETETVIIVKKNFLKKALTFVQKSLLLIIQIISFRRGKICQRLKKMSSIPLFCYPQLQKSKAEI
jgi:hypothetical protein